MFSVSPQFMMGSTYWETFPTGSLILSRRLWMNFISEDLNIDLDMDRKSSFKLLFHLFRILIFRFHTKTAGDTKFPGEIYSNRLEKQLCKINYPFLLQEAES